MGPSVLAPGWQQPYINVFRLCDVEARKEVEILGEVKEHMDRIIGKKVYKVRGLIPAANYVRVPRLKSQSLGLTGRFLYMQIKVSPVKVFVVHLDVVTTDLITHRVSISSMYKELVLQRKSSGIQIPFPRASHRWCIVAVDMSATVASFTSSPFHSLRSVQLCSWLTVRSLYTSDLKFSPLTLPSELALSHALDSSAFDFLWLPAEPMDVQEADAIPMPRFGNGRTTPSSCRSVPESGSWSDQRAVGAAAAEGVGARAPPQTPAVYQLLAPANLMSADDVVNLSPAAKTLVAEVDEEVTALTAGMTLEATATAAQNVQAVAPLAPGPVASLRPPSPAYLAPSPSDTAPPSDQAVIQAHGAVLEPDPFLQLQRVNAFSGEQPHSLTWPPHSEEVVFMAGSVVVAMTADGSHQRFFMGHTGQVIAVAFDAEGAVMASAQDGKQAVIRVWDFATGSCLAVLCGHASGLLCLDVSRDGRALVAVGLDASSRQLIVLWDISQLRYAGRPEVVVKQTTEYNIRAIRFSAFEEDQLVTCGRDNVRTYRLRHGGLRGLSVRTAAPDKKVTVTSGGLAAALGPNVFTDIAFDTRDGVYAPDAQLLFVASASGALFQIDYTSRTLLCVFQLHAVAINSLVVCGGVCVTGSDDRLVRVWPLDFSDYLMQAEHEAGVSGVGVSFDGLRVAVGTESGAIGVLDVPSQHYATLLRSHLAPVRAVAADPNRDEYVTGSADGTIRVWSLEGHQQLAEFDAPSEVVTALAYHPTTRELAAGFANGRLRIFDLEHAALIQEHQQHRAELTQLVYSPDGNRLYTGGADSGLCVYDVPLIYQPTKFLAAGTKDVKVCLAVSGDGRFLASVAHDPYRAITSILIFYGDTLEPYMRIETDTPSFSRLVFSPDGNELWAVAAPNRLDRYELVEGQLVQQVTGAHRLEVAALVADPGGHFVLTAGLDGLVKVWGVEPADSPAAAARLRDKVPPHQAFGGHPSAVLGCALRGRHLITVGDVQSIFIWRVQGTSSRQAQGSHGSPRAGTTARRVLAAAATPATAKNAGEAGGEGTAPLRAPDYATLLGYTPNGLSQNVVWRPGTALFAYAVDHIVVVEDLASHQQTFLSHFKQHVACVTASHDGRLLAAAGAAAELSGYSEVVVWRMPAPGVQGRPVKTAVLQYHPVAVEGLAFSHDGSYLVSIGRDPERSLAVWEVGTACAAASVGGPVPAVPLAAVARTRNPIAAVAWLPPPPATGPGAARPRFISGGASGLLLWTLQPHCLEQVAIPLPSPNAAPCLVDDAAAAADSSDTPGGNEDPLQADGVPPGITALGVDAAGVGIAADAAGHVWEVELSGAGLVSLRHVAHLPGNEVTRVAAAGPGAPVAVGTMGGLLAMYRRAEAPGGVWACSCELRLDGSITCLCFEPGMAECVAATAAATIWCCRTAGDGWRVPLVVGHASPVVALAAPRPPALPPPKSKPASSRRRSGLRQDPQRELPTAAAVVASASPDAVRVWSLGATVEPLAEFQCEGDCSAVALVQPPRVQATTKNAGASPDGTTPGGASGLYVVAGFGDGTLRGFSVPQGGQPPSQLWYARRHTSPIVGVECHPGGRLALSAGADGTMAVTEMLTSALVTVLEQFAPRSTYKALRYGTSPPAKAIASDAADPGIETDAAPSGGGASAARSLCAIDVCAADASVCAAAWRTHLVVFSTPWRDSEAHVIAVYKCDKSVGELSEDVPAAVRFMPQASKLVAYTSPLLLGKLLLFDYRLGSVVKAVAVPQMLRCLCPLSDGTALALGGMTGGVFLVDAATGKWEELSGHRLPVASVAFSPDGSRLLATSGNALLVWALEPA